MKTIEYRPTGYPSDLTDTQWEEISCFFPNGNKSKIHKRSWVEAVLCLMDNGCKWRALPYDYPKWSTVKSFTYRAVERELWEKIKGRKCHIATDIMGNLLIVKVRGANIHDTMSGWHVYQAAKNKYTDIQGACADERYKGTFVKFI